MAGDDNYKYGIKSVPIKFRGIFQWEFYSLNLQ